jgi:hypothetical protein
MNPFLKPLAALAPAQDGAAALQRYEFKYAVPADMVEPIGAFIHPYCEMDMYAAREPERFYTITSLYLDSPGLETYWAKQSDARDRFKMRIRTYGRAADGPVRFEIKRRINEVSRKTSVPVPPGGWAGLVMRDRAGLRLTEAERSGLRDFQRLAAQLSAAPKMLIRYERRAFVSRIDRYVRISFDKRMRCQTAREFDLGGDAARWRHIDDFGSLDDADCRVILELKFMTSAPVWLTDLVRRFGLFRRGYSKYCCAVERTVFGGQERRALLASVPGFGVRARR